jgi:hypothetical protein
MVAKIRNTIWPPPPQLSLHRRAALLSYSNGTRSVYSRENPKRNLYCEMSVPVPCKDNREAVFNRSVKPFFMYKICSLLYETSARNWGVVTVELAGLLGSGGLQAPQGCRPVTAQARHYWHNHQLSQGNLVLVFNQGDSCDDILCKPGSESGNSSRKLTVTHDSSFGYSIFGMYNIR